MNICKQKMKNQKWEMKIEKQQAEAELGQAQV